MRFEERGGNHSQYGATIRCEGRDSEDLMKFMEELTTMFIEEKSKAENRSCLLPQTKDERGNR